MPSGSLEPVEFESVFEGRVAAQVREQTHWDATVKRRRVEFAKLRLKFEEERRAWDRSRARQDARKVRARIARAAPSFASVADQLAAGLEGGLLEAALANVRVRYKARAADVAAQGRVAMAIASGRSGWPAIPPPVARTRASVAFATNGLSPDSAEEVLRAAGEEQQYLDGTARRHFARFAELQSDFARRRAVWDCLVKRQDAKTVNDCVERALPFEATAAQRAEARREGDLVAWTLARVRDDFRAREEDASVDGRRAMYAATAWTDRCPAIPLLEI